MAEATLNALLYRVQRNWNRRWTKVHAHPPSPVFHYTDARGLKGIVDTNRIWASNALYLNDSSELVHAREVVGSVLEKLDERYGDTAAQPFLTAFRDSPLASSVTGTAGGVGMDFGVYIVCFCEQDDLLSQWRGYPGEGGGYTLAFDLLDTETGRPAEADGRPLVLRRVVYDADEQRSHVLSILEPICKGLVAVKNDGGENRAEQVDACVVAAAQALLDCSFCFKHPTFAAEAEWRLIFMTVDLSIWFFRTTLGGGAVAVRPTRTGLVPYVELALGSSELGLPIRGLTVGPTLHPDLAERAARMLLNSAGYRAVPIKRSSVPLRV